MVRFHLNVFSVYLSPDAVQSENKCQRLVLCLSIRAIKEGGKEAEAQKKRVVSWCFKSSQPPRIISRLKETFIKRYIVERANKAEIRPEEQSKKAESGRENFWNEIQLKGT